MALATNKDNGDQSNNIINFNFQQIQDLGLGRIVVKDNTRARLFLSLEDLSPNLTDEDKVPQNIETGKEGAVIENGRLVHNSSYRPGGTDPWANCIEG